MRKFQTIMGGVITLMNVTDLDEDTVIGFEVGGLCRIFNKKLEIHGE